MGNAEWEVKDDIVNAVRTQLRQRADDVSTSPEEKEWLIEITRYLRLADLEDKRKPSTAVPSEELIARQSKAWASVIDKILDQPRGEQKASAN